MKYFKLHPEVPGGIGPHCQYDKTGIPWTISHLHLVFDGWMGSELLKISTCYLVTDSLKEKLLAADLTGITGFAVPEIEKSPTFENLYPGRALPAFSRIMVENVPGETDLATDKKNKLVVSEKALNILQGVSLGETTIETYVG